MFPFKDAKNATVSIPLGREVENKHMPDVHDAEL
jgi:hypothetical protein